MDRNQSFQMGIGIFGFVILILIGISFYIPDNGYYLIWGYWSFIGRNFIPGFILDPFFVLLTFGTILLLGVLKKRYSRYKLEDISFQENTILFKSKRAVGGFGAIEVRCGHPESLEIIREIIKIGQAENESQFRNATFSIEYSFRKENPNIQINIFIESKTVQAVNLQIEKGLSLVIDRCHFSGNTPRVNALSGEPLKSHFYEVLGGLIHDFDIDRGEMLILNNDEVNYISTVVIRKKGTTLSDFEYILRNLDKMHSANNEGMRFVFSFRYKGRAKVESSLYVVYRSESCNALADFRNRINLAISPVVGKKKTLKVIKGRNFVQNIGLLLTRGLISQKHNVSLHNWVLKSKQKKPKLVY